MAHGLTTPSGHWHCPTGGRESCQNEGRFTFLNRR
jgi:hypothetical protein